MPPNSTKALWCSATSRCAAEPRHRRRIHQDCARHTGSDRMLQYQRQLRLPAENPRPRYEILPGVCAQCAWHGGESCVGRKRIRDGRAEARIRHTHLKSALILNVWRELPADGCDSHAFCSSGRYNGGRNCASLFFSGISPNHG